jgi:hypothetical protein
LPLRPSWFYSFLYFSETGLVNTLFLFAFDSWG